MNLRLNVDKLKKQIPRCDVFRTVGKLRSVRDILTADLSAHLGELCEISDGRGRIVRAEVIGVNDGCSQLMTYNRAAGLAAGMTVVGLNRHLQVPIGEELLGRVVNGLGHFIDGGPTISTRRRNTTEGTTPDALRRRRITRPLVTGQRAIDGLLTIGQGQRIGLFAGSGVGKSTLLGEIAKNADADLNVIALIGERGREVVPFLEDALGEKGLAKSVVVIATADETPLIKVQAVRTAMTIAEDFRDRGNSVLFFMDSLTRVANAQKEIGLARGEAPGQRGFPASVQSTLAALLERLGNDETGSITGLITILVEGGDLDEPISDAARSILDGHIILDRKLAAQGHYPAIDVPNSLSRLFREVTSSNHQMSARDLRKSMATYQDVAELIQVGLYQSGTSPEVDAAIERRPHLNHFLQQTAGETSSLPETLASLERLFPTSVREIPAHAHSQNGGN